ncbi:MAG TPA: hypothetical protein VF645_12930 [Allosphingosinicella sp.]|jgi:uncharacterized coiled-coil DUF342 family protein
MFGLPDVAVGAVVAAFLTGIISLLGLIISKEQKTSEYRQAWIDSLRSEISQLIAHINVCYAMREQGEEDWSILRLDAIAVNQAAAQIKLRLNPEEKSSRKILQHIEDLEVFIHTEETSFERLNQIEEDLAADAQALLKAEWVRVRRGELTFRVAKLCAAAMVVVILALLLVTPFLS